MPDLTIPFLDLARHYRACQSEIDAAVARVLERGWFVLGPEVAAFERAFADWHGVAHAVGVNSGTDAIELALRACGVGPGQVVVTTPLTAVPTVCAIVAAGATPAFVDIDPKTFQLDPDQLRHMVRFRPGVRRPSAVVPVHLYGHPVDLDGVLDVASEFELTVVEDVAQATGATWRGRKVGTFGRAAAFSFYPTKNLGAFGDGGLVLTDEEPVADRLRQLRNYGETSKYMNRSQGRNTRLDELQAAILLAKLPGLYAANARRRELARRYRERLAGLPLALPVEAPGAGHVYHLFVVRVDGSGRDDLRSRLESDGIGTSVHYPMPVHLQEAYRPLGFAAGQFPHAERACREILSLPLYPELRDHEVDRVAASITELLSLRQGVPRGGQSDE